MKRFQGAPVAVLGVIAALAAWTPLDAATEKWFPMQDVEVRLPKGIKAKEGPGIDWRQFNFTTSKKVQVLSIYVGDHPDFARNVPAAAKEERLKISGFACRSVRWESSTGAASRELLMDQGDAVRHYRFIHAIYTNLAPGDAALADDVIASLRPVSETKGKDR